MIMNTLTYPSLKVMTSRPSARQRRSASQKVGSNNGISLFGIYRMVEVVKIPLEHFILI